VYTFMARASLRRRCQGQLHSHNTRHSLRKRLSRQCLKGMASYFKSCNHRQVHGMHICCMLALACVGMRPAHVSPRSLVSTLGPTTKVKPTLLTAPGLAKDGWSAHTLGVRIHGAIYNTRTPFTCQPLPCSYVRAHVESTCDGKLTLQRLRHNVHRDRMGHAAQCDVKKLAPCNDMATSCG